MPNLLLAGHFGCGNLGDDAIMNGFAEAVIRQGLEITAMSGAPEETFRNYGYPSIGRKDSEAYTRALATCDAVVFAGGSIFQDVTSMRSAIYYATMIKKAKKAGKPVFLVGQGVGPLNRFLSKRAAASAFMLADAIVVRDPASAQALKGLGVNRPIRVGADPAFLMPPAKVEESQYGVGDRKTIGIAPRVFGKGIKEVTAIFGEFARNLFQSNYMPVMIAMDRNEDGPLIQAISDSQGGKIPDLRKLPTPSQLVARIGRMDAVVSVRLHGSVLATCAGTPSLAIAYDPKVAAFAKLLELNPAIPIEGLTSARLFENFQAFMKSRDRNLQIVERRKAELTKLAEVNVETVIESLKGAAPVR